MQTLEARHMISRVPSPRPPIELERESALQWVARREDLPGECELVTTEGCTCYMFRFWRRCEHHALLVKLLVRGDA